MTFTIRQLKSCNSARIEGIQTFEARGYHLQKPPPPWASHSKPSFLTQSCSVYGPHNLLTRHKALTHPTDVRSDRSRSFQDPTHAERGQKSQTFGRPMGPAECASSPRGKTKGSSLHDIGSDGPRQEIDRVPTRTDGQCGSTSRVRAEQSLAGEDDLILPKRRTR